MKPGPKTANSEQRLQLFMKKVSKQPNGCWRWIGALSARGYGVFYDGTRTLLATHYVVENIKKLTVNNLLVCHSCDNKDCVNPDHLFLGTYHDNMKDAHEKNLLGRTSRFYFGEVWLMRKLFKAGFNYAFIAKMFKSNRIAITRCVKGEIIKFRVS